MFYPTDATPKFAAVVFSPASQRPKESSMNYLGELLASHGIATLLTTPTTTTADLPNQRAAEAAAARALPVQKIEVAGCCATGRYESRARG